MAKTRETSFFPCKCFTQMYTTAKQTQGIRPCTHEQELPEIFHKHLVHKQRNPPALNKENHEKVQINYWILIFKYKYFYAMPND